MVTHLKERRGVLSLLAMLGMAVLVLWIQSTTPTAAHTTVGLEDISSEVELLQSGELSFTSVNCNIVCITQIGECATPNHQRPCSTPGSNCCCKWCQDQWGCYPSVACIGPAP